MTLQKVPYYPLDDFIIDQNSISITFKIPLFLNFQPDVEAILKIYSDAELNYETGRDYILLKCFY